MVLHRGRVGRLHRFGRLSRRPEKQCIVFERIENIEPWNRNVLAIPRNGLSLICTLLVQWATEVLRERDSKKVILENSPVSKDPQTAHGLV